MLPLKSALFGLFDCQCNCMYPSITRSPYSSAHEQVDPTQEGLIFLWSSLNIWIILLYLKVTNDHPVSTLWLILFK